MSQTDELHVEGTGSARIDEPRAQTAPEWLRPVREADEATKNAPGDGRDDGQAAGGEEAPRGRRGIVIQIQPTPYLVGGGGVIESDDDGGPGDGVGPGKGGALCERGGRVESVSAREERELKAKEEEEKVQERKEELRREGLSQALKYWVEEYNVRKAQSAGGARQPLEQSDKTWHFLPGSQRLLVPRKSECGFMKLERKVGELSKETLLTGITETGNTFAPPVLLEQEGPLKPMERDTVEKAYLHPIIFPSGPPEAICRYYRRLYQIANVTGVAHQSIFLDRKGEPCINRQENQLRYENYKPKWLAVFIRDFIDKRVPKLTCPKVLQYWEWFFSCFSFESALNVEPLKRAATTRLTFNWRHCTHFLQDDLFFVEIYNWSQAELTNYDPYFHLFYKQIQSRPKPEGPAIERPPELKNIVHNCSSHEKFQWREEDFISEHPHLSHLLYGIKYIQEYERARNQIHRVYKESLQEKWVDYEKLLKQKYRSYLFHDVQPAAPAHPPPPPPPPPSQPAPPSAHTGQMQSASVHHHHHHYPPSLAQQFAQQMHHHNHHPHGHAHAQSHAQTMMQPMGHMEQHTSMESQMQQQQQQSQMNHHHHTMTSAATPQTPQTVAQQMMQTVPQQQSAIEAQRMHGAGGGAGAGAGGGGAGMPSYPEMGGMIQPATFQMASASLQDMQRQHSAGGGDVGGGGGGAGFPAEVPAAAYNAGGFTASQAAALAQTLEQQQMAIHAQLANGLPAMVPQGPPSGYAQTQAMMGAGKPPVEDPGASQQVESVQSGGPPPPAEVIDLSPVNSENNNVFEVLKQLNNNITKLAEGRVNNPTNPS